MDDIYSADEIGINQKSVLQKSQALQCETTTGFKVNKEQLMAVVCTKGSGIIPNHCLLSENLETIFL